MPTLPLPSAASGPAATAAPVGSVAVIDMGATAIRLVVAETQPGKPIRLLEEVSRGVLLGKDTFTHRRLGAATIEAALAALEGFRRIMDPYGVVRYRAVATSAVREAENNDTFLDRIRLRTRLEVEIIDGSEESRLTYKAVREKLRDHPALISGETLLVSLRGGSANTFFLQKGQAIRSGTHPLGSIRLRQNLVSWRGNYEQGLLLLRRYIQNVVSGIRPQMPLRKAQHFIALGRDVQFAAEQILGGDMPEGGPAVLPKEAFLAFCDKIMTDDVDQLVEKYRLPQADAETLVPALLAHRELLLETSAPAITVSSASLCTGLLLDLTQPESRHETFDFSKQVLASAAALGVKYRWDEAHSRKVAHLATRLFDQLRAEHGLGDHQRLLLQVAALLHDVGHYINLRRHHKHSWYILSVSELFGLSQEDMALVANIARYHCRSFPQDSHFSYTALDRRSRVLVNKLAAILRLANAMDASHLQKVKDVKLLTEDVVWVLEVEGLGDLTMERLASLARADLLTEVFGRKVIFREAR